MALRMTEEECWNYVIENRNLIGSVVAAAKQRGWLKDVIYENDDLMSDLTIEAVRIMGTYDDTQGTKKSTWLYRCLNQSIRDIHKKELAKKRSAFIVSYDTPTDSDDVKQSYDTANVSLSDENLGGTQISPEEILLHDESAKNILAAITKLTPLQKMIVEKTTLGIGQAKIAEMLGCSQANVSIILSNAKNKLEMELLKFDIDNKELPPQ